MSYTSINTLAEQVIADASAIPDGTLRWALFSRPFGTATLARGSANTGFKVTSFAYCVDAVICAKGNTDDIALPAFTLATGGTQYVGVYIDAAGAFSFTSSQTSTDIASLPVTYNSTTKQRTCPAFLGYIKIVNATGSDFVSGTTALNASNVTTTFVNCVFPPLQGAV